ncbi:MAG: ArsR family transcriptional regulator [Candidatus Lokiarchaeota archaeon]|nr:ArsR family transcriptional regulator [Candidatus Lokiarchaeota archaeon]
MKNNETSLEEKKMNKKLKSPDNSDYWWIFGRKGGKTRSGIIDLLIDRPYNAQQIAEILHMSYRNIKHHLKVLQDVAFVMKNDQKYGKLYLLNPNFDRQIYNKICDMV